MGSGRSHGPRRLPSSGADRDTGDAVRARQPKAKPGTTRLIGQGALPLIIVGIIIMVLIMTTTTISTVSTIAISSSDQQQHEKQNQDRGDRQHLCWRWQNGPAAGCG